MLWHQKVGDKYIWHLVYGGFGTINSKRTELTLPRAPAERSMTAWTTGCGAMAVWDSGCLPCLGKGERGHMSS